MPEWIVIFFYFYLDNQYDIHDNCNFQLLRIPKGLYKLLEIKSNLKPIILLVPNVWTEHQLGT